MHDSHDDYPLAVEKNSTFLKICFPVIVKNKTEIQYEHRPSLKASSDIINKNKLRASLQNPSIVYGFREESPQSITI